ncbi:MAG: hypothetical protein ACTHK4_00915, partial [Mycobacteriales bacterium]
MAAPRFALPHAFRRDSSAEGREADAVALATVRGMLRQGRLGQARTFAQRLQHNPASALVGDVCRGLVALREGEPERAWALFERDDPTRAIAMAPVEVLRAGFRVSPAAAIVLVRDLLDGRVVAPTGARVWRDVAGMCLAIGAADIAACAIARGVAAAGEDAELAKDLAWLQSWLDRREAVVDVTDAGRVPVAVLNEEHPRRRSSQVSVAAAVGTEGLVAALESRGLTPTSVPRDASSHSKVPDGTWLLVTGRLPRRLFGVRADLPFDPRFCPIFVSIEVDDASLLTDEVVADLRTCGPVGCRSWDTYYLMRAARVPAFVAPLPTAAPIDLLARAIASGADPASVYAVWRTSTSAAVDDARRRDREVAEPPRDRFDVVTSCRRVHEGAVVMERTEAGPGGAELAIEMTLAGNLKRQMVVVLDSIERRATRPLRVFALCRDHDEGDYRRMAELFPAVSFHWLPTDRVEYGELAGVAAHISAATMDRLLLPDLLADVGRIVHHDLDAICLADLAELAECDLEGHPIAACPSPRSRYRSGFAGFRAAAERLRDV